MLDLYFKARAEGRDPSSVAERVAEQVDVSNFNATTLAEVIDKLSQEAGRVLAFDWDLVPHTDRHQYWGEFRRAHDIRPQIDEMWAHAYIEVCKERPSKNPRPMLAGTLMDPATMGLTSVSEQNNARDVRNRLLAARDADLSAVYRLESDHAAAVLTRDAIERPPGMVSGLLVLALLTVTSVIIPVLLLAPTPATLTYAQSVWVVALFFVGIAVLFAYLGTHALRLRGIARQSRATGEAGP